MTEAARAVEFSFAVAAAVTGGRLFSGKNDPDDTRRLATRRFHALSIDSRDLPAGCAFLALRGERVDGHDYAAQAAQEGASLLILEALPKGIADVRDLDAAVLLVDDTTRALGDLARAWRDEVNPQVIGITGSVGKTTTKELTRQILAREAETHATPGNYNNHIGLPLTLLSMPKDTRFLIAEMGMNNPGEIAYLTHLARPDVAAITAIAPVHVAGLGSLEAIAAAKAEIWTDLGTGIAVAPNDEPLLAPHLASLKTEARRLLFGGEGSADVRLRRVEARGIAGTAVTLELAGLPLTFELPIVGAHNAKNAACAAAIALALGLGPETIAAGLTTPTALNHRSTVRAIGSWRVLDDCYNASPVATRAALDTLIDLAGGKPAIALLGPMFELGDAEAAFHREVGAHAASLPLITLITVGEIAADIARGARDAGMDPARLFEVETPAEAGLRAAEITHDAKESWLLVKGSRGAHMEEAIKTLADLSTPTPHETDTAKTGTAKTDTAKPTPQAP
ncbi:MAG: UDP-N-acetylmuramoyl-tripeptide--D-alanyl-D-alanine ligase [Deltaproteobacteria bacterium]|nr:UDP-N-acetylmuramoyl-tripeptide--D-alanyl-D-alanine ligase [Deltaproteobacteria bacterium]